MNANELRIGNLILVDGKIVEITGIKKSTVFLSDGFQMFIAGGIEPIPLTEEWLIKFGFDKVLHRNDKMYYRLNDYFVIEDSRVFLFGDDTFEILKLRQEIKYVHQLQNLYFALTGEELTIKL